MPDGQEFLTRLHAKQAVEDAADLLIIQQAADHAAGRNGTSPRPDCGVARIAAAPDPANRAGVASVGGGY